MHNSLKKSFIIALAIGALGMGLTGCATTPFNVSQKTGPSTLIGTKPLNERYEQSSDEIARVAPLEKGLAIIPPQFQRSVVNYASSEAPGTIIVEPSKNYLYLIAGRGKAVRYGVGVGAAGLGFQGEAKVQFKRKWPKWIPTKDMVERSPSHYKRFENGVAGGIGNPLGARALYLFQDNKDTYYRIHGTTQPTSIGKNVSAGCIRMLNNDVVDLYERVAPGAKVIVR